MSSRIAWLFRKTLTQKAGRGREGETETERDTEVGVLGSFVLAAATR